MQYLHLLNVRLDLFDGAAASSGEGTSTGSTEGGSQQSSAPTRQGKSGGKQSATVVYGKQAAGDAAAVAGQATTQQSVTTSDALEDRRRAYQEYVRGENKDLYEEDVQNILNRRFRDYKTLQERQAQYQPIIDRLMEKYSDAGGDVNKLIAAIDADDAWWTDKAEEAGMTVDQYRRFAKLQRENEEFHRQQQANQQAQRVNAQMQEWYRQADDLKKIYPSFDLAAEAKNPQFLAMLKSGTPVQHAYEVLHLDEIKAGVASMQARATEQQIVAGIRAKGARPAENGASAASGFVVKDDVTKLSKADRAEIARRVARGERISF